jgi:hypothetical protein
MRYASSLLFATILLIGCAENGKEEEVTGVGVSEQGTVLPPVTVDTTTTADSVITHSNERFRNVTVTTVGEKQFKISGEAQVFEASISWTIEDGHNVLQEGHEMTSAGAPEWGKFEFTVTAEKERENSTLHLILYEASARDGSRQHELPLLLY